MQVEQMTFSVENNDISLENPAFLTEQLITYLGNKRSLLPWINSAIHEVQNDLQKTKLDIIDVFSGSGVVSRNFKQFANVLYSNDLESYARVINQCYLTNKKDVSFHALEETHRNLVTQIENNLHPGFIAEMYAPRDDENPQPGERVFFTQRNASYIDTARQSIETIPKTLQPLFLAPLLSEVSIHANTSGVFKGFYKNREGVGCFGGTGKNALTRILGEIKLDLPIFSNYECEVNIMQMDAKEAVRTIPHLDLAYLDPPYNQHPYGSNYFMLNLVCDYQKPIDISQVSGIPKQWNRSPYNKSGFAKQELFSLIDSIDSSFVLISYNSEGFVKYEEFTDFLHKIGQLKVFETKYNTFRGSRNLRNRNLHTSEFLFLLKKG